MIPTWSVSSPHEAIVDVLGCGTGELDALDLASWRLVPRHLGFRKFRSHHRCQHRMCQYRASSLPPKMQLLLRIL